MLPPSWWFSDGMPVGVHPSAGPSSLPYVELASPGRRGRYAAFFRECGCCRTSIDAVGFMGICPRPAAVVCQLRCYVMVPRCHTPISVGRRLRHSLSLCVRTH